jgi:hypothetical protein
MVTNRRPMGVLVWLRSMEVIVVVLTVWVEFEFRIWFAGTHELFDLPYQALALATLATSGACACFLVRWLLECSSRWAKVEAAVLLILTLHYPFCLLLCCL